MSKGRIKRGARLRDVAAAAGVSNATVSAVANGQAERYGICQSTRERVAAVIAQLGYTPSLAALDMVAGRNSLVGLAVATDRSGTDRLLATLEPRLAQSGRRSLLAALPPDPQAAAGRIGDLMKFGIAGLVVVAADNRALPRITCPAVILTTTYLAVVPSNSPGTLTTLAALPATLGMAQQGEIAAHCLLALMNGAAPGDLRVATLLAAYATTPAERSVPPPAANPPASPAPAPATPVAASAARPAMPTPGPTPTPVKPAPAAPVPAPPPAATEPPAPPPIPEPAPPERVVDDAQPVDSPTASSTVETTNDDEAERPTPPQPAEAESTASEPVAVPPPEPVESEAGSVPVTSDPPVVSPPPEPQTEPPEPPPLPSETFQMASEPVPAEPATNRTAPPETVQPVEPVETKAAADAPVATESAPATVLPPEPAAEPVAEREAVPEATTEGASVP